MGGGQTSFHRGEPGWGARIGSGGALAGNLTLRPGQPARGRPGRSHRLHAAPGPGTFRTTPGQRNGANLHGEAVVSFQPTVVPRTPGHARASHPGMATAYPRQPQRGLYTPCASPPIDETPAGYACRPCGRSRRALRDAGLWDATPVASSADHTLRPGWLVAGG
jgi:hypothetical protein